MEGTLGCVTGFATKIGSSIGAGVLGVLLSASGYVGDMSLSPDSAVMMIRSLFSIVPAVCLLYTSILCIGRRLPYFRNCMYGSRLFTYCNR